MAERKRKPKKRSHRGWWLFALLLLLAAAAAYYFGVPKALRRYYSSAPAPSADVAGMRAICSANVSYQYAHPKEGYAKTLADLGPKGGNYIDSALASGQKGGYRYEYVAKPGPGGRVDEYRLSARPLSYSNGERSYYSDDECDIHWTKEDRAATAGDPKLQ